MSDLRMESSEPPADEYLFDGGDRTPPVHYDDFHRHGLDTEDTLAEYVDHTGEHHVEPSNRVAIYAPRFGAVRTIGSPAAGVTIDHLATASEQVHGSGLRNRISIQHHAQRESPEGIRVRSRASGLETETLQESLNHATKLAEHTKLLNLYAEISFLQTGKLHQSDEARVSSRIQAALAWTHDQFPVITASTDGAQETYAASKPQELIGREERFQEKGRLRIVKLADKKMAAPGDVVTFTIRYDNLGDRELNHIRIVDNLTPRLQYVEQSATSDRSGQIEVEDNAEGSLLLTFELDAPLPGGEGGVITFQAKVR